VAYATGKQIVRFHIVMAILVFAPWLLAALGFGVAIWADANGCTITARDVTPCIVLGRDIGPQLYPLFGLGYFLAFSVFWVVPGLLLWLFLGLWVWARHRKRH